jgi:hypothetical protein
MRIRGAARVAPHEGKQITMKTLSSALVATALLAAAPALAENAGSGENLFAGSTTLRSYGTSAQAAEAVTLPAAGQQTAQAQPVLVSGDRAIDPIYFGQPGVVAVQAAGGRVPLHVTETDFIRPYGH